MDEPVCARYFLGTFEYAYYPDSPFAEERARYLAHLLERGWRAAYSGDPGRDRARGEVIAADAFPKAK